ncbi:homoserine kinase [Lentibacillus lipolyticus]|nr:homoserine kinase [Lentibacillus lipolyticus]
MKPFQIRVPASSANLGPGFDSVGLALDLPLTVDVSAAEKWEVEQCSPHLSTDEKPEDNYIVQIAREVATRFDHNLPACKLVIRSDIPLARGLGSSASAIVAGIELANQLCALSLSTDEKLAFGNEIEGHPDNIAPALVGGFVISTAAAGTVDWVRVPDIDTAAVVYIPSQDLKTEAARQVLPESFPRERATAASSVSNVLIASLLSGDVQLAGKMMENDLFHEPYRAELIPHYNAIRTYARENGAYGTVISGAGPTMLSLFPKTKADAAVHLLKEVLPAYDIKRVKVHQTGVEVSQ